MSKNIIMDKKQISSAITELAEQIASNASDISNFAVVGIRTNGDFLAARLTKALKKKIGKDVPLGILDITLYRDDLAMQQPMLHKTEINFDVADKEIILVDDVLFTGRTVRSALDAIIDFGRPKKIKLAVLIDRGHRELPITADYVSCKIETKLTDEIDVTLKERDGLDDLAVLR